MHLSDICYMNPNTPHHILEWDVLVTCRQNFRTFIFHFYNSHYEIYCATCYLNRLNYTINQLKSLRMMTTKYFKYSCIFSQLTFGRQNEFREIVSYKIIWSAIPN